MASPLLLAAAALTAATAVAHSVLGERYILTRLFRRDLPKLFGSDDFTKRTLRFAWHVTSVAWLGIAAILAGLAPLDALFATFVASSALTLAINWRHVSWLIEAIVAALIWFAR